MSISKVKNTTDWLTFQEVLLEKKSKYRIGKNTDGLEIIDEENNDKWHPDNACKLWS